MDDVIYDTWVVFVQIASVIVALFIIGLELYLMHTRKVSSKAKGLLLIFWMFHAIVYYVVTLLIHFQVIHLETEYLVLTSWSASLRLHGLTTILIVTILCLNRSKMVNKAVRSAMYGLDPNRDRE